MTFVNYIPSTYFYYFWTFWLSSTILNLQINGQSSSWHSLSQFSFDASETLYILELTWILARDYYYKFLTTVGHKPWKILNF